MNIPVELWWFVYGLILGVFISRANWRDMFPPRQAQPRRTAAQRHTRSHYSKATRHGR